MEWICKTWICKRWICKRWICKTWICKRWICKRWICKRWICKTWICKRCICKKCICKTWICKTWICKGPAKQEVNGRKSLTDFRRKKKKINNCQFQVFNGSVIFEGETRHRMIIRLYWILMFRTSHNLVDIKVHW